MSLLNELKKLEAKFPNDQEFGNSVRKIILANKTCCDNKDNLVEKHVEDAGPYGYYGTEIRCKICGKIVDFKLDK